MKRMILTALALLACAIPAAAQQGGGRMGGPPQSGRGLFNGITLTAAQQKVVDSLYNANQPMRDKMRAKMDPGQRPDAAQMAKMRVEREKGVAAYRNVLTSDQQKVFDQNITEMRSRMGGGGAAPGAGAGAGGAGTPPPSGK